MLTREERIDNFNSLHDILWNSEGFDPITSRNTLLSFFSIRLIEEHAEKLNLSKVCRYSEMIKLINDGGSLDDIAGQFLEMLQELKSNPITRSFFPNVKVLNGPILRKVFLKIDEFSNEDLHSSDILGELYEVVGSGDKANSEIGQYFTSRSICKIIANVCIANKKSLYKKVGGENVLKNFLDPFCGTGGFTREFISRANELDDVDWIKYQDNIYSFDRNKTMIPIVLLNLLFTTGKIFTREYAGNIISLDSFRDDISTGSMPRFPEVKYDFIFTNPPFGGDSKKDSGFTYSTSNGKGKDKTVTLNVNQDIQTIGIVDNDKVSAAVQLCMALLAPKGLCAAVLPQGFFFSSGKAKVELRKKLIEEYKVHMIIDIPQDAFLGTTTKTSVLIFQKGAFTDQIVFMDMNEEIRATASLDDLRKRNYSLDEKLYFEREEVELEGFETMRLGDLVERVHGKSHAAGEGKDSGEYPFLVSSNIKKKFCEEYDYEDYHLVIGNGGVPNVHYEKQFSISTHMIVFKSKSDMYNLQYIYYILKFNKRLLDDKFNGTTIKNISLTSILDINIPVPSIEKQQEIIELVGGLDEVVRIKTKEIKKSEDVIMRFIKFKAPEYTRIKLSEVLRKLPKTKRLAGDALLEGEYPFLVSSMDKKRYCDEYDHEEEKLIVGGGGNANIHLEEKFAASGDMLIFELANENFLLPYIYYYLLGNMELLSDRYQGTTIKHINIKSFLDIEIPDVPLEKQKLFTNVYDMIRNGKRDVKSLLKTFNMFVDEMIPKV